MENSKRTVPSTPPKCSGVILAGGLGSRLQGVNKARMTIGGRSLLDRILTVFQPLFDEIVLVTCTPTPRLPTLQFTTPSVSS